MSIQNCGTSTIFTYVTKHLFSKSGTTYFEECTSEEQGDHPSNLRSRSAIISPFNVGVSKLQSVHDEGH